MNLEPLYRFLIRTRALALFDLVVTRSEKLLNNYRYDRYGQTYDLHESFLKRRNGGIELYGDGEIHTGAGSYIGRHSRIKAGEGTTVTIGDGCPISHNVAMYTVAWDPDQDFGDRVPTDFESLSEESGDIVVGDDVWIGYNVFVTPGTTIGENSVIGANSVVTRDIPPDCIAAGSPARVVKFKRHVEPERRRTLARQYSDVCRGVDLPSDPGSESTVLETDQ